PSVGLGYIQIGDTTHVNETLLNILNELRAMRMALTQLACEGAAPILTISTLNIWQPIPKLLINSRFKERVHVTSRQPGSDWQTGRTESHRWLWRVFRASGQRISRPVL